MNARVPAAALSAALWASTVPAQTVQQKLDLTREAVESQRRILVSGSLRLSDAEAQAFWPLYDGYEKERQPLDARANRLVADFLAAGGRPTEAQARSMLDEGLKIEEARAKLRRSWYDRMAKAVSARELARFYQIENKLDAVVRADLSKQIPLAR